MFRKPSTVKAYQQHKQSLPKDLTCEFCTFDEKYAYFVRDYGTFQVIENRFPYAMWDNWLVDAHLMLVPKRHIHDLKEFTAEESADFLKALVEYDELGYCIWIRDQTAKGRTVPHQHTHFIKISNKHVKGMVFHQAFGNKYLL